MVSECVGTAVHCLHGLAGIFLFIHVCIHAFMHIFSHSLTHSPHSLILPLTQSIIHPSICQFPHSVTPAFIYSIHAYLIHLFNLLFIYPSIQLSIYPCIHTISVRPDYAYSRICVFVAILALWLAHSLHRSCMHGYITSQCSPSEPLTLPPVYMRA